MNCYAVHKFKTLSVVALFVAIVSILATLSSLAQVRDVSRTSAESSLVSAPAQASRSPQALAQQLLPGTVSEQGIPARRPRKRSTNSAAADSGSVGFLPAVTYDAGGGVAAPPGSLAVADVNGDGKPDITSLILPWVAALARSACCSATATEPFSQ
jgi:hypothetical protein